MADRVITSETVPSESGVKNQSVVFTWLKRGWGFLIVVVTLIAAVIGIVTAIHQPTSALTYEIQSDSDFLDRRTDLQDVTVLVNGEDIRQEGLLLRIMDLTVRNTGDTNIVQGQFDELEPFGVGITGGRVIRARLLSATSDYLSSRVAPKVNSNANVEFSKVIIDKGESFSVELLILHNPDLTPQVTPIGKVAGVQTIEVKRTTSQEQASNTFPSGYQKFLMIAAILWAVLLIAPFVMRKWPEKFMQ